MQFILTGFTQDMAFRVFAFERMGLDRVRTKYAVKADLALVRRYGIQVQELPLLCRNLLARCDESQENHTLTFTEDDMCLHAKDRAAAKESAAQKRKPPRRPASENVGAAWRGHHPLQTARPVLKQGIDGQAIIEAT
ncbi:MAG: hypothetical protein JWO19_2614 [Bryobacterales bacterium]|nr:hypothetical protein [Bryobacterales bacterium]